MNEFIRAILKNFNIDFISSDLDETIKYEPYPNTFYSLSNILKKYNIPNYGIKIENKHITQDMCPFIAIVNNQWVLVESIHDNVITYFTGNGMGRIQQTNINNFIKSWNGKAIALGSFLPRKSKQKNITKSTFFTLKLTVLILSLIILTLASILKSPYAHNWMYYGVLISNCTGIFICYLIQQQDLNYNNPLAKKICGLIKNSNCSAVTNSRAAYIIQDFKLSDIGLAFFIVNTLVLILFSEYIYELALYSVIVLPFSFWSIWYQKHIAKSWCALCLTTLFLMWIQAGLYAIGGIYNNIITEYSVYRMIMIGLTYLIGLIIINKLVQIIKNNKEEVVWHRRYNELKVDQPVIDAYIGKQSACDISIKNCSSLIFGNPNAQTTITIFSNPLCGPCARMHSLIKNMPGDIIKIQYVMTYFSKDYMDINKAIIASYFQLGAGKTWEILTEWFDGGKLKGFEFFRQFNLDITARNVEKELKKQDEWARSLPLEGTPTDFINGREIVWPYTIEDYMYLAI